MFRQSERVGDRLFEFIDKVERETYGNGLYFRRMVAIDTFRIPNTRIVVRKGQLGGLVECSYDGEKIYPIVSAYSWLDADSVAYAGAFVEDTYLINSAVGKRTEGGEYIYSNTYYRKTFCINSVIINSSLLGYTVIDDVIVDEQSMGLQHIYLSPKQLEEQARNEAYKRFGCRKCTHYFTDSDKCALASDEETILNYADDALDSCPSFVQKHTCGECVHFCTPTPSNPNIIHPWTECELTGEGVSKDEHIYCETKNHRAENFNCADFCSPYIL